jgi:sec-independent protein translocase protein TatB
MFDFAWSEIAVIGVVALVAIGPKDMPAAIKAVTDMIKKARRMASEFQTHVDEMVREADLGEVRDQFNQLRNFNVKREVERAVDSDGSIRATFASNPMLPDPPKPVTTPDAVMPDAVMPEAVMVEERNTAVLTRPAETPLSSETPLVCGDLPPVVPQPEPAFAAAGEQAAPAFIPPGSTSPEALPAFVPPGARKRPQTRF